MRLATAVAMPLSNPASAPNVSARERLVYEREGGGAPSERSPGRPATILQKLWRSLRPRQQVPDTTPTLAVAI